MSLRSIIRSIVLAAVTDREQEEEDAALLAELVTLLDEVTDIELCRLDHNGHCQAHCWFSSARPCATGRAQRLLVDLRVRATPTG